MNSPTLGRLIICALIASALLFLKPDQTRDPLLNKNGRYSSVPSTPDKQSLDRTARTRIEQAYGKLPMRFEANQGQTDPRVKFTARGAGYAVFLTADETVLHLRKGESENESSGEPEKKLADQPVESAVLRMKLVGSNQSSHVSGIGRLRTTSNYFIGNDPAAWRRGISNYAKVKYDSVYPGIDLVWYGNQQLLEHDFLIAPGADPSRIRLSFSGTEAMSIDGEGALVLHLSGEDLRLLKPQAWQESNGSRRTIACNYRLSNKDQVEFRLGDYDSNLPLVIDPVLVYSTYIGGLGTDFSADIAVDGEGAAYLTGRTDSADFPGPSPIQPGRGTLSDAFVLKINPAGDAVVFGAWIGGNGSDSASAISVDAGGNVYLAGTTSSLDFPLQNPLQATRSGSSDVFAAKIDSSGSALLYSTYIGGTGTESAPGLAVDGNGNLYLSGTTDSIDFPVVNAFQPAKNGSGAYTSEDGGEDWGEIRNGLSVTAANDLVIFPGDSSTIFAGTDRGVFKTPDRGATWNLLGGAQFISSINQIIVDPTTTDILYAVSANQLFKSIDGGATWSPMQVSLVRTVAIDPTTPSMLYAGTSNGLSISANGGDSWTPVFIPSVFGGPIGPVESIAIDPITPATVYVGSSQGIYKSVDRGTSWTFAGIGLPISSPPATPVRIARIAISRGNPAIIYALADNARIFRTIDGGAFWFPLNTPGIGPPTISQSLYLPLVAAPDNSEAVYVGSRSSGLFKSNDGGTTWNTINNGLHGREIRAIVFDPNSPGRVYAGSYTSSDAFIVKLNESASSFIYSSYIGGGATDIGGPIAIDSTGAAYLAGFTNSPNFPVVNAFQAATTGLPDAFVVKLNSDGSAVSWATYLGGSNPDQATGIAVSATGNVFVGGVTTSNDFPVNSAIQHSINGSQDGFITKLKNDGSALDFSTYLGGAGPDNVSAITVDSAGDPYVTGTTSSLDFPVINAVQSTRGGNPSFSNSDAFVTKLSADGTAILYSTYLGGSGTDQGNSIAVDAATNAYVTGIAFSINFPTTPFPIRSAGPSDAFVAKLGLSADLAMSLAGDRNPVMINNQLTYSLIVANNGPDPAINSRVMATLPAGASLVSSAPSQGSCTGTSEISCELGILAAGGSATITIIVTPSIAEMITNTASATSGTPDINPANNTATLATNVSLLPSIYGRVTTAGGVGLSGITVAVNGSGRPPFVTPDDGNYQFAELAQGASYTVTPSRQGYVFNPPNRTINNLQNDQRADFQGVACNLSISSASQLFPATGGMGSVTITSPDPQCAWTATSNVPWVKFISAPAGNGSAIVRFKVEPTIGSRSGTITINDTTIIIYQEFNACSTVTFNIPKPFPLTGLRDHSLPANLVAEDFNKDSVSDILLYVTQPVAGLNIALSNSAGGYDDASMFYSGGVRTIRTGDLNNDGVKDIALITNEVPRRLLILNGDGVGRFSAPVNIDTGPSPTALAIVDLNSDGRSDLAVGTGSLNPEPGSYNLAIHLGDSAGGFAAPRDFGFTTSSGSFPSQIEAGDFNGDGNRDLAVMGSMGSAIIFTGDGSEGFTISTLSNVTLAGVMALGDFNGDLKTDLAISQSVLFGSSTILIWLSTPAGMLQSVQPVNFAGLQFAADFNGDGRSDLTLRDSSGISILYAISDGRFTEPIKYLSGGIPNFIALGDFKPDGRDLRTDIFAVISRGLILTPLVDVAILTSDPLRGFDAPRAFNFTPPGQSNSGSTTTDIESGDFNSDGVLDLVIASSNFTGAVMMFGDGRGEFRAPVSISSGAGAIPLNIEPADFNNDGKLDLAVLNSNPTNVVILLGDGQGGFTQSATFNTGTIVRGLESADFNNDSNLDVVVKAPSGGLALFLGNGQGEFTQSATGIGGNLFVFAFTSGDFNGDGNADLALSDSQQIFGAVLVILFGNGQGGFGESINVRIQAGLGFLDAADLNLDGRDDLFGSPSFIESPISVILSSPGGGFAAPIQYQVGARMVISKDVNGDGKLDLIAFSNTVGIISVLLGNGDGSFNQPVQWRVIDSPAAIATGDFDEDGSIDMAVVRDSSAILGVLRNRSMCVPEGSVVAFSAASNFRYRVARNSIVALQGENLATSTRTAIPPFLPTSLANTRVKITDSAGSERQAPLYFVSPDRINLLIPAQTSPGIALITVTNGGNVVAQGTAAIAATAPGLFSVDLTGQGYAAALVLRIRADGRRVYEPIVQFDFEQNRFLAVPIDLSSEAEQVFLLLTGTGIRNHSGLANVRAKIGEQNAEVTSADSQGILPGVDQVDVRLQPALRGRGEVSVELSVDGRATNSVRIKIK
jgi:uncharacterized protein (TIGR03437 family)